METVLIGLLIGVLAGAGVVWLLRPRNSSHDGEMRLLQDQLATLTDKLDSRLDKSQEQMRDSIAKQMQSSNKIIKDVTERLTKLDDTNKRVVDVADELKTLQNVLQNPKQRGVLGEYYLQTVLENVLPAGRFQMQYRFEDGEIVDAVIFLQDDKFLPVDSKFSLENYNRLVDEKDKVKRDNLTKLIKSDLKKRIDETSKYIRPSENTMDFAFMFLPSEAMYYDLLIANVGIVSRDLIEYAFQEKKVIIVSPTSFLAYLQTVLQGLKSLQIEEQAKEIQKRVGMLGRHLEVYDGFMQRLGSALGTTVNHYNRAHKELKKVDKDVVKIAGTTDAVEPLVLDRPKED
jgi:DNA recombination protein RmuC